MNVLIFLSMGGHIVAGLYFSMECKLELALDNMHSCNDCNWLVISTLLTARFQIIKGKILFYKTFKYDPQKTYVFNPLRGVICKGNQGIKRR